MARDKARRFAACMAVFTMATAPARTGATIVNTLQPAGEDGPGWSGRLAASYASSGGNTEQATLGAEAALRWHRGAENWRLQGSAKRTSSSGIETAREVLGHLRHNHRLDERWATVAFVQLQENPFQRLKYRFLTGAGARWDALRGDGRSLSVGATHMWEREQRDGAADRATMSRLSAFVTLSISPGEGVRLEGTAFYQPAWDDFADWRAYLRSDANLKIAGSVAMVVSYQREHESRVPTGVENSDWQISTGLNLGF